LAVVNRGLLPANVTYTLHTIGGETVTTGHGVLAASAHFAKFIDQLKDVAPDFSLPPNFGTTIGFGSLEITSDQALSILALRLTINERGETVLTSTPAADLTKPLSVSPIYFPQFVSGGGYTTALLLINTSGSAETGKLTFLDDNGRPLVVNEVEGAVNSSFSYAIPVNGAYVFQTDGGPAGLKVGSVRLTPDVGSATPVGSGIVRFSTGGVMVTESGIPATTPTTHARVFVDKSGGHDTGLAIAAPDSAGVSVSVIAFQKDGKTVAGKSNGPVTLGGNGHKAAFVGELVSNLPNDFTGVLDLTSSSPFVALTLRSLTNARNEFILTTFPIADINQPAPSPIVFPQIADGGGYTTQFILLSANGGADTTVKFFEDTNAPLAVRK
jgi:hypothetical protein